jgi:hypothetical protein
VVKRHQHHYEAPQEINGIEPRDWAMRQGWGGRPVQVEQAQEESGRGVRGTLLWISVGWISAGRTCRRCEVSMLLAFGCPPRSTADVDGARGSRVGEHVLHHLQEFGLDQLGRDPSSGWRSCGQELRPRSWPSLSRGSTGGQPDFVDTFHAVFLFISLK